MSFISPAGGTGTAQSRAIAELRDQIDSYSRLLASGKKAATNSGLGQDLSQSIDLRARLSRLSVYQDTISSANTTVSMATSAVDSILKSVNQTQSETLSPAIATDATSRQTVRANLRRNFSQMIDYLNTDFNGVSLFGGKDSTGAPCVDPAFILDGSNGKAGLTQYITERQAADLGANGQGRLQVGTSATSVTLAETVPGSVFGFKINGIKTTDSSVTVSGPTGSPSQASFTLSAQPAKGSTFTVTLGLPDGTTTDVVLTADGAASTNKFAIGATMDETISNISTSLQSALGETAQIQLFSASAKSAAEDFFKGSTTNPPRRVAGPPFDAATSFTAGSAANTVLWYQGADDRSDPRNDHIIKISDRGAVGVGARANEPGFVKTLASMALLAVAGFSTTDETAAQNQFGDLRDRARAGMVEGNTTIIDTNASLLTVQKEIKTKSDEQTAQKQILETALGSIENAPLDETAVTLSTLQTQLQALYQLTAKLSSLSLANYI